MASAPRLYCPAPLVVGATLDLPATAARHAQVLRLQPGDPVTLFGGTSAACAGGEFEARVVAMGRQQVQVVVGAHHAIEREPARELHLAIGVPANERMNWLVEKATELGVALIQPLMTERSVVRLEDERAKKKSAHWSSIAVAACEQCGRNKVPLVRDTTTLVSWLRQSADAQHPLRLLLSLRPDAMALAEAIHRQPDRMHAVTLLSGPEGGLSPAEEEGAIAQGFLPVSLGARVLRSETAALAALTLLG